MKVTLERVRLAFPSLFEKDEFGKFGAAFLLEPDHAAIPKLKVAEDAVAKEKWGAKAEATMKEIKANGRDVVQDGDKKASYDGYAGNKFVNANSDSRPGVYDRNKQPLVAGDGKPYAGCYVDAIVEVWAQDNQWGKRINAQLTGVRFREDGDNFSAGAPPAEADDFADLGVDEDAPDPLLD